MKRKKKGKVAKMKSNDFNDFNDFNKELKSKLNKSMDSHGEYGIYFVIIGMIFACLIIVIHFWSDEGALQTKLAISENNNKNGDKIIEQFNTMSHDFAICQAELDICLTNPNKVTSITPISPQKKDVPMSCCNCASCPEMNINIYGTCYKSNVYIYQKNADISTLSYLKTIWYEQNESWLSKHCIQCNDEIWCVQK
jgi:hypothetical protein